jgi:hypothetical protein
MFIFNLGAAAFKVYCAIWVRRSSFRHKASPRVSPREKVEGGTVDEKGPRILRKMLTSTLHLGIFYMP